MRFQKNGNGIVLSVSELSEIAYPAGDLGFGFSAGPRVTASVRAKFLEECGTEKNFTEGFTVSYDVLLPEKEENAGAVFSEEDAASNSSPKKVCFCLSEKLDGIRTRDGECAVLYHIAPVGGYDAGGRFRARFRAKCRASAALYCLSSGEGEVELCTVTAISGGTRLILETERCSRETLLASLYALMEAARPVTDL